MIQGYLITAGATALIAFGGGWKVHSTITKAKANDALEKALEEHNEAVIELEAELQERDRENFELSTRLDAATMNVRTEYRTIEKEVPKYVPIDSACDLGPDFVRLFNNAATRNKNGSTAPTIPTSDIFDTMP